MIAVGAIVADTAEEAARLAGPSGLYFTRLRTGARPTRIPTMAEAEAHNWTQQELGFVAQRNAQQAVGDLEHATSRIRTLVEQTGANEVIVTPQGPDLESKLRTLRDLAA
jgi:alkanesulfonate monooxygenase SsuD/methylene tetrahydromethanopterin reductase-like flavin-dependent oxidoreductase (luciferase family)